MCWNCAKAQKSGAAGVKSPHFTQLICTNSSVQQKWVALGCGRNLHHLINSPNNNMGQRGATLLPLLKAHFSRSTQDLQKPHWCLCTWTHTCSQTIPCWLIVRATTVTELGWTCGEGKWNKETNTTTKKNPSETIQKGDFIFITLEPGVSAPVQLWYTINQQTCHSVWKPRLQWH